MRKIKIPERCSQCPLKDGLTRHCGKIICRENEEAAGLNYWKVPDDNCLLKGVQIPDGRARAWNG